MITSPSQTPSLCYWLAQRFVGSIKDDEDEEDDKDEEEETSDD